MEVAGLLGSWGRWWHAVHREAGGHEPGNMALLESFLASGCWHSKGHPGWSFSIMYLPVPACEERKATMVSPSPVCDSAVAPRFLGC